MSSDSWLLPEHTHRTFLRCCTNGAFFSEMLRYKTRGFLPNRSSGGISCPISCSVSPWSSDVEFRSVDWRFQCRCSLHSRLADSVCARSIHMYDMFIFNLLSEQPLNIRHCASRTWLSSEFGFLSSSLCQPTVPVWANSNSSWWLHPSFYPSILLSFTIFDRMGHLLKQIT